MPYAGRVPSPENCVGIERATNGVVTHVAYIDAGALMPDEVREQIAAEENSPYAALDLSRELPEPMMEHGTPGPNEEGLSPLEDDPQEGNAETQVPNG